MQTKKFKNGIKIIVMAVFLIICCMNSNQEVHAATADSDILMTVKSSCYTYTKQKAETDYRASYVTFGQNIEVVSFGDTWAKISLDGNTEYILSKNLDYREQTVVKNRVMVSPGAYACSAKSTLGYVYYGTDVDIIEEVTNKKGVTYVHCIIAQTYKEDGVTVYKKNVEGYINKEYMDVKATPMVVTGGSNLYYNAYGASASEELKKVADYVYCGTQLEVMMSNTTWSKVKYNENEYFISTSRLEPLELSILANRVIQTADAKPGSGAVHYVYWNTPITVLNTYESDNYGTYYYCEISGDYGFIREYSNSGVQYVGYQNRMITNNFTTLYEKASVSSNVITKVQPEEEVNVKYMASSWSYVEYDGKEGYISTKRLEHETCEASGPYYKSGYRLYKNKKDGTLEEDVYVLARKDKYGYAYVSTMSGTEYWMKTSSLKEKNEASTEYTVKPFTTLYAAADSSSESIIIPYMSEVQNYGAVSQSDAGNWYKLGYDGSIYYLWVASGKTCLTDVKSSYTYSASNLYQEEVIELAMYIFNNWDTKYAHGQSNGVADTDGKYGFDCSGFATYVIETVMTKYVPLYNISSNITNLYNTTAIYNKGYTGEWNAYTVIEDEVSLELLQPGDILFFNTETEEKNEGEEFNHCGIYLGNGEFIHSTNSWDGSVRIMPLTDFYEEGFVKARRYIPNEVVSADKEMYTTSKKTSVYPVMDSDEDPIAVLGENVSVTLKFYNNGNWSYVEYQTGKYGYILTKYLE